MGFFILIATAPIFWLIGVITFIRWLSGSSKKQRGRDIDQARRKFLESTIRDLESISQNNNNVQNILKQYKAELNLIGGVLVGEPKPTVVSTEVKEERRELKEGAKKDISTWWVNWYQENTINLLLYIGTFLIVVSASIFVGFNWEQLSGPAKALILDILTLGFFASGGYFYYVTPKLKSAGATFLAIGALLIPFNGLAWYNFHLATSGVDFSIVWAYTSVVSLIVYAILAFAIRNQFYAYITGLGSLSLVESLVSVNTLNLEFYVLGGVFSAFVLLLSSRLVIAFSKEEIEKSFALPLNILSQIILPIFLVWGIFVAASGGQLFSIESTLSLFLATIFYILLYLFQRNPTYLALSQALAFSTIGIASQTFLGNERITFYLLYAASFLFLATSYLLETNDLKKEAGNLALFSVLGAVLFFLMATGLGLTSNHTAMFAFLAALISISASRIQDRSEYLYSFIAFLNIGIFIGFNNLLKIDRIEFLGIIYLLLGLIYYFLANISWNQERKLSTINFIGSFLNLLLATAFTAGVPVYLLTVNIISVLLLFASSLRFNQTSLATFGNIMLYFSLWSGLRLAEAPTTYYPLYFSVLSFLIYFAHHLPWSEEFRKIFRYSGIIGAVATPIYFGYLAINPYSPSLQLTQFNSLVTAYAASGLLTFDAITYRNSSMGYLASIAAMLTYLWQINYLNVVETQAYTLPVGAYFLGLAYIQRAKENVGNRDLLNFIGLFFLLVPTFAQSLGSDGAKYALILGLEGVALIWVGISLNYKIFTYSGVAAIVIAILSQTYDYLTSLPRWVITGTGGLVFLAAAIYLLSTKKENK